MSNKASKSILSDLGRATKRGVRKCPKCGFYNGTRGISCKNKQCDAVFKDVGGKRKACNDAVELDTGNSKQVYSVRVRDRGPDYRGFVQLSLTISSSNADALVIPQPALCFVDSCQYLFHDSILKCHEPEQVLISPPICHHVESALKCVTTATPLSLKNSVICALNISNELRQELWTLISQSVGPLVQRVSKYVMAVKCDVTSKHPLGYLHFTFSLTKSKDIGENKYFCTCASFKVNRSIVAEDSIITSPRKCIHYYACICAFASDTKLSDEFMYFINTELPFLGPLSLDIDERLVKQILDSDSNLIDIREDDQMLPDVCLPVPELNLNNSSLQAQDLQLKLDSNSNSDIMILPKDSLFFPDSTTTLFSSTTSSKKQPKKFNNSKTVPIKVKRTIKKESKPFKTMVKIVPKTAEPQLVNLFTRDAEVSFIQWLASVTERINQTMHCQFSGTPDPLIFHIPQVYFECLRERISFGSAKKRLPNFTKTIIRKDSLPLGTFYKYTWHITNIFHVKQIFDTPLVSLHISKSFTKTCDGYKEISYNIEDNLIKSKDYKPIKPLDIKTYLKVGNTSWDQVDPTPFTIDWIPDILPISKVGELQIQFQFGKTSNIH